MGKKDVILFLTMITFSLITSERGVSYSFIFLSTLWILFKAKIILEQYVLLITLILFCAFRFWSIDEKLSSILNFALITLLMLSINKLKLKDTVFFLKSYINLSLVIVVMQFFLKNYFDIYFNQVWDSSEALGENWRPNGISFEPSYASTLLVISGFSLGRRLTKFYIINIGLQVLLFSSSFGLVGFLMLILSRFSRKKYLFLVPIILFLPLLLNSFEMFKRVNDLTEALLTFEVEKLVSADHSASIRIAPFLILFGYNWFQLEAIYPKTMWEYKSYILESLPGVDIDYWEGGGFLPASIFSLGVFALILYYHLYKKYLFNFSAIIFFIIAAINIPFSTQAFGTLLILLKVGYINYENRIISDTNT